MPNPPDLDRLFEAARAARLSAYAPYSGYAVGAAIRDEAGRIWTGCNVENAAYPVGTCAEAGAIAAMGAGGGRRLREIAVVADGSVLVAPCGACRQRIAEFGDGATRVHMAGLDGAGTSLGIAELLPLAFGPRSLADAAP